MTSQNTLYTNHKLSHWKINPCIVSSYQFGACLYSYTESSSKLKKNVWNAFSSKISLDGDVGLEKCKGTAGYSMTPVSWSISKESIKSWGLSSRPNVNCHGCNYTIMVRMSPVPIRTNRMVIVQYGYLKSEVILMNETLALFTAWPMHLTKQSQHYLWIYL